MTLIDTEGRKRRGQDGFADLAGGRGEHTQFGAGLRQIRTLRQKKLCDMSRTGCEGAMKTPENGRTNPSGGKWARGVTGYASLG